MQPSSNVFRLRDGRELFAERSVGDPPIAVFEAGLGSSRNMWGAVTALLANRVSTVAYDRSGLGRSAATTGPRELAALAADLGELLDQLGNGPFVLVGHSWGGPIVRSAAAAAPGRVRGLVLVDPTDERCDLFFRDSQARADRFTRRLAPTAARLGLLRLPLRALARPLPPAARAQMLAEDATPRATAAALAELASWNTDLRSLRDAPPELPAVPVTVISGGRITRVERRKRPALIEAHRASAAAAPLGRHVVAERSTHYVPFTEPQLVADEILRIVALKPPTPGVRP